MTSFIIALRFFFFLISPFFLHSLKSVNNCFQFRFINRVSGISRILTLVNAMWLYSSRDLQLKIEQIRISLQCYMKYANIVKINQDIPDACRMIVLLGTNNIFFSNFINIFWMVSGDSGIVLAADIETLCIFMKKQKQYRYFADTTRDQGSERRPELSTKESAEAGAKAWGNSEVPKKCRFFLSGFMNTIQDSQFFTPKNISGYAWNHKKTLKSRSQHTGQYSLASRAR